MHEKILIPPAVHDEPHFAKKTLVLAVLLSATSMFATAASVNVVTLKAEKYTLTHFPAFKG